MKSLAFVLLCAVLSVFSLGAGWYAANQSSKPAGGHSHGVHDHGSHDHGHDHGTEKGKEGKAKNDDHDHDHAAPAISPQALLNMGVKIQEVASASFTQTLPITAVVEAAPLSERPLLSPVGGTVSEVLLLPGSVAEAGTLAFRIVRDPYPRPTLALTDELIKPAAEQLHASLAELKRSKNRLELLRTELKRIQPFTQPQNHELPVLPRKTEIDLRSEIAKAEQDLQGIVEKLRLHGMSETDIQQLESGAEHLHFSSDIWQRALRLNGLWPAVADDVFNALPQQVRQTPWAVAALGELSGAGLTTQALADWLKREPAAAAQFIAVAGLLQSGSTLEHVQRLHEQNALAAIVDVKIPKVDGVPDWDVHSVAVKPNTRVETGASLAVLSNSRTMQLVAMPEGSEIAPLLKAFQEKTKLSAEPFIEGTGAGLNDLSILFITGGEHTFEKHEKEAKDDMPRRSAVILAVNVPLGVNENGKAKFRTWHLHPGALYQLRVPQRQYAEAYVLPADAVTDDGPDKVVFVKNGDTFESRRVVVQYQNVKTVVLDPKNSDLFPGDEVVTQGAFALSLALKAGSGNAGHDHGHMH